MSFYIMPCVTDLLDGLGKKNKPETQNTSIYTYNAYNFAALPRLLNLNIFNTD